MCVCVHTQVVKMMQFVSTHEVIMLKMCAVMMLKNRITCKGCAALYE